MKLKHVKTAQYKWQVVFFDGAQRQWYENFFFYRVLEGDKVINRAKLHLQENDIEHSFAMVPRQGATFKFKRKSDAVWFMMYDDKFFKINNLQDPQI